MSLGNLAAAVGKGLFAGVVGTAAMAVSSTLEAKLSGRGASAAPADAAKKVLGVEPMDADAEARFSNMVHWGYGTAWGSVHGLFAVAGLSDRAATHLALPALDAAPPVWELGAKDLFHRLVYSSATGMAYSWLDRSSTGS